MQNTEELNNWLSQFQIPNELAGTIQKCKICGSEFTVRKSGLPPRYGICKKCKCSFTSKNRIVTKEQKTLQKEKACKTWKNKSEEEKKNIIEKRKVALNKTCTSRSEEEKEEIGKHISEVQRGFSEEKKAEISEKKRVAQIKYWEGLSEEEKKLLQVKNSESHSTESYKTTWLKKKSEITQKISLAWFQKSEDEKKKIRENKSKTWSQKSEEERRQIRSKATHKYVYDDEYFDSSWELAVWIYAEDHNLTIEREPVVLEYEVNGKVKKYFPDFRLNGELIEVKGDHFFKDGKMICPFIESLNEVFEAKHQCGLKNGVKFWTSKEMKPILEYVEHKYLKGWPNLFYNN